MGYSVKDLIERFSSFAHATKKPDAEIIEREHSVEELVAKFGNEFK